MKKGLQSHFTTFLVEENNYSQGYCIVFVAERELYSYCEGIVSLGFIWGFVCQTS
jgi:hypothetical protein